MILRLTWNCATRRKKTHHALCEVKNEKEPVMVQLTTTLTIKVKIMKRTSVITSTLKPDISLRTFSADNKEDTGKIHSLQVQQPR